MNVAKWLLALDQADGARRDRLALVDDEERLTHRQLRDRSFAAARALAEAGVRPGDRVLLVGENSAFWVASYLGGILHGAVVAPVSPSAPGEQFADIIADVSPAAACVGVKSAKQDDEIARRLQGTPLIRPADLYSAARALADEQSPAREDETAAPATSPATSTSPLAAIMYTSGSTGRPRGVMITHANVRANTQSILDYLRLDAGDRMMVVLPFYYCFGTSLLHTHLRAGSSLVLNNQFMFPDRVLRQMQAEACTGLAGVPSTYQILLAKSSLKSMRFPALRHVQQAGGRLPAAQLVQLADVLPCAKIFVMYGQTEATARLAYLPPEMLCKKPDSVGQAIPGVTLELVDEAGQPVKPGDVGQIVAAGENIAAGYWNDLEATRDTFRNGKLWTGDLAATDEDGYLSIVGRAKDFLKCAGYRVSAREIEDALLEFPGAIEAAVIAMPDALQGEAVRAFLVHRNPGDRTRGELETFCVQRLRPHLVPKDVVFVDALPKNDAGKVLKSQLREIHA